MEVRTRGIILRTRLATETSLIIQWLTEDRGRVATIAKGARRPKSPFRGKLDLFYEADFTYAQSRKSELHTLREVMIRNSHPELRKELGWVQQAAYGATLIERTTETETPLPNIFRLTADFFSVIPLGQGGSAIVLAFETKLLNELGLLPELSRVRLNEGVRQILIRFRDDDFVFVRRLRLDRRQSSDLAAVLRGCWGQHLGELPRGRAAALEGGAGVESANSPIED